MQIIEGRPQSRPQDEYVSAVSNDVELHNITPEHVLFCYRASDADSLEVAERYRILRKVPSNQLLALPCSQDAQISQADYLTTIEQPILDVLDSFENPILVIILGYHVPNSFVDSEYNVVACASRLHRVGHGHSRKYRNPTYDRKKFQFFDTDDAQEVLVTAVIDGPTKKVALNLIDRGLRVDADPYVKGSVLVDPYAYEITEQQGIYQADILSFLSTIAPKLGLTIKTTVDINDPYDQPTIFGLYDDSFYWGWSESRYSQTLFHPTGIRRVFLYNADTDSAGHLRDALGESDPWCNLAIGVSSGFASCAGAVAAPGEDAYLRPTPFFDALMRGASIGEAFLYASPYVDWKIILIGDPLSVINFPAETVSDDYYDDGESSLPFNQAITMSVRALEETLAWRLRQADLTMEFAETVVTSGDLEEQVAMQTAANSWRQVRSLQYHDYVFSLLINAFIEFLHKFASTTLDAWLTANGIRISSYLRDRISTSEPHEIISDSNVSPTGEWDVEFVYEHNLRDFQYIHFGLQVANDPDFLDIVVVLDTQSDNDGWVYEYEPGQFTTFPAEGFPSNFAGVRRVRYVASADKYLTTLEVYYARWYAHLASGEVIIPTGQERQYVYLGERFIITK